MKNHPLIIEPIGPKKKSGSASKAGKSMSKARSKTKMRTGR